MLKAINVKDAIDWNDKSAETIQKCFAKSGFIGFDGFERQDTDSTETVTSDLELLITEVTTSLGYDAPSVDAYINIDGDGDDMVDSVHAGDADDWENELLECAQHIPPADELTDTDSDSPVPPMPTPKEVMGALEMLEAFTNNTPFAYNSVMRTEEAIQNILIEKRTQSKQYHIKDFFQSG